MPAWQGGFLSHLGLAPECGGREGWGGRAGGWSPGPPGWAGPLLPPVAALGPCRSGCGAAESSGPLNEAHRPGHLGAGGPLRPGPSRHVLWASGRLCWLSSATRSSDSAPGLCCPCPAHLWGNFPKTVSLWLLLFWFRSMDCNHGPRVQPPCQSVSSPVRWARRSLLSATWQRCPVDPWVLWTQSFPGASEGLSVVRTSPCG